MFTKIQCESDKRCFNELLDSRIYKFLEYLSELIYIFEMYLNKATFSSVCAKLTSF